MKILNANFGIFICCGKSRRMRILATNTLPTSTFGVSRVIIARVFIFTEIFSKKKNSLRHVIRLREYRHYFEL